MLTEGMPVIVIGGDHAGKRGTIGEINSPHYDGVFDAVWIGATIAPVAHNHLIEDVDSREKTLASELNV